MSLAGRIPVPVDRKKASALDLCGHVVLESESGALVAEDNAFTYLERGVILQVAPASGQLGTIVEIEGARLFGGGQSIATVELAGVQATVVEESNTTRTERL